MSFYGDIAFGRRTPLSQEELNKRAKIIADAVEELRAFSPSWEAEVEALRTVGLDRINDALLPAYQQIIELANLGSLLSTTSTSTVEIEDGIKTFVIPESTRKTFAPAAYLMAYSGSFDNAVIGRAESYDYVTGILTLAVESHRGSGTFSTWQICPIATTDDLEELRDQVEGFVDAAQTARTGAEAARDVTVSAKNLVLSTAQGQLGSFAFGSFPTTRTDGSALQLGDTLYDTTNKMTRAWDGAGFAPIATASIGGMRILSGVFGPAPTGIIAVGGGFSYAMVWQNGSKLAEGAGYSAASPNITFTSPVEGEEWAIWGYSAVDATDYFTKEEVNGLFDLKGAQTGDVKFTRRATVPPGWMKANGAAVSRAAYPELDSAIYVGDANNGSAIDGYRCTNPANPSGTRSTSGAYLVLPDIRGEFIRGWDDGRGVDPGRAFGSAQSSQNLLHGHTATSGNAGLHDHDAATDTASSGSTQRIARTNQGTGGTTPIAVSESGLHNHPITVNASGGTEARPRNLAYLALIKY